MTRHAEWLGEPASTQRQPLDAVLFDMDGVITDTARAHAAVWKQVFDEYLRQRAGPKGPAFQPFDPGQEYRRYVDGKPRYDGVKSFLESRGIELPYGNEDDGPEKETVCGLGNRKNQYFQRWLTQNRVRTYPGTLALIRTLRQATIKIAAFSASRNAQMVLRQAGVLDLFDVVFDGKNLAEYGLPGKPDPAMVLKTAGRVGVPPERAAVVEDAIAGVEAGVAGGFGLVIGVARSDGGRELQQAGAHLVVHDASELVLNQRKHLTVKTLANLPSIWDREQDLQRRLAGKRLVVFLDYDGTLTPIVKDHTRAWLSGDMRAAVADLGTRCPVIIVSGRDLTRLQHLVELDSVGYAGSHGFEIVSPEGAGEYLEQGVEFLPELDQMEQELRERLTGIKGHAIERKRFSIALHYRQVADADIGRLESVLEGVLTGHPRFCRGYGKKVFEIKPDIDWNKGRAILWLLDRLGLDRPEVVPLYVGDDITDEDAFHVLAGRGLSVVVRDHETRQTAADFAVTDTKDVKRFLDMLASIAGEPQVAGGKKRGSGKGKRT